MTDQIETLSSSLIQHGKFSNRIYLMDLGTKDVSLTIESLEELAKLNHYTKIIVKSPRSFQHLFESSGYIYEATIPYFYNGEEDLVFMSKFYTDERETQKEKGNAAKIIRKSIGKLNVRKKFKLDSQYQFEILKPENTKEMTEVFKKTFKTYPFPIFEENYLIETMEDHVVYFGIRHKNKLVAISSCEVYVAQSAVEMTDFAILERFRGNKLSLYLLQKMEDEMRKRNIKTAYSMSNAQSFGMNITFAKFGYKYTGTLINNANLGGSLKSLNIWYKPLTVSI